MISNPKVDVIIPTYKPGDSYTKLLDMLANQTYPVNKIWIMNTEEKFYTDWKFEHANDKKYENVHVTHISKREFNHGRTRREGVNKSSAEIFVMMTDDAIPRNEQMIENLIAPLIEDKAVVSYARQVAKKSSNEIEKFTRNFNYPRKSKLKSIKNLDELGIKTIFCSNVCAAYNREIYDKLGGFDDYAIFNEDMIYASKVIDSGMKIAYTASAEVIHSHDYGNITLFKRNFDMGVSQAEHPEIFKRVSSTGEGKKLVSKTIEHLRKRKKIYLIPKLIINSGFKFMGYKLGLMHKYLPKWVILRMTSMKEYWVGRDVYEKNMRINYNSGYGIAASERVDGRKIHKASRDDNAYVDIGRKPTIKDEIKVRPKDKMVDRRPIGTVNEQVKDNREDTKKEIK